MTGELGAVHSGPGSPLPQRACFPIPPSPIAVLKGVFPGGSAVRAGVSGPLRLGNQRGCGEEGTGVSRDSVAASSSLLLGPLYLPASPGSAESRAWLPPTLAAPSSPSTEHSFPGTSSWRQHLLLSQPEFASCWAACAPPREQPRTRLEKRKRKDRKKERGRVNRGESRAGRAARESGRLQEEEEEQEVEEGCGAPRLPANLLAPGRTGWTRCAGTMCLRSPQPPPSASSGRAGCADAPSIRVSAAGRCPVRNRQVPQVAAALAAGRGSQRGAGGFTCCQDLHYGLDSRGPWRRP